MIFKRAVARLRAQDWVAIAIELAIVIVGVLIATQVANWNVERLERRENQRMLERLSPELRNVLAVYAGARSYYALTRDHAATAFAGWQGDTAVSDRDFVIAAYQASQIYSTAANNSTWATIFGADRLQAIEDPVIRDNLSFLMYADTNPINNTAVDTSYRQNVRRVIPVEIQDAIRAECGDRRPPDNPQLTYLPKTCDLAISPAEAASAAKALRARPQLVEDLRWHTAAAASFLANMAIFEAKTKSLASRIDSLE
jgi:hypothetical protein